jgi:mono/diheme cytochrome c family protein
MDRKRTTIPVLGLVAPLIITGVFVFGSFSGTYGLESETSITAARAGSTLGAEGFRRASGSINGEEVFKRQCAVCHGDKGQGDGPASAALRPKPADLTDPEKMGEYTQTKLVAMIGKGKGMMPAFGAVLNKQDLEAVAGYVHSLSREEEAGDK